MSNLCRLCNRTVNAGTDFQCEGHCRKILHSDCMALASHTYPKFIAKYKYHCIFCNIKKFNGYFSHNQTSTSALSGNLDLIGIRSIYPISNTEKSPNVKSQNYFKADTSISSGNYNLDFSRPSTSTSNIQHTERSPGTVNPQPQTLFTLLTAKNYSDLQNSINSMWKRIQLDMTYLKKSTTSQTTTLTNVSTKIDAQGSLWTELKKGFQNMEQLQLLIKKDIQALQAQTQELSNHFTELKAEVSHISEKQKIELVCKKV